MCIPIRNFTGLQWGALFSILFGIATVFSGGSVLFSDEYAAGIAGNIVPFVVWFNFLAGFFYILAGVGLLRTKQWAMWLGLALAGGTALVFLVFLGHIFGGGAYESRTVIALLFRTLVWGGLFLLARRFFSRNSTAG